MDSFCQELSKVRNYSWRLTWAKNRKERKYNLIHMIISGVSQNTRDHGYNLFGCLKENGGIVEIPTVDQRIMQYTKEKYKIHFYEKLYGSLINLSKINKNTYK